MKMPWQSKKSTSVPRPADAPRGPGPRAYQHPQAIPDLAEFSNQDLKSIFEQLPKRNGGVNAQIFASVAKHHHRPHFDGFANDRAVYVINLFDRNRSGYLDIGEFIDAWRYVETWCTFKEPYGAFPFPAPKPVWANDLYWDRFVAVDRDHSGAINVEELHRALYNDDYQHFDLDTVKHLMKCYDKDNSGEITFEEFALLRDFVQDVHNEWLSSFGAGTRAISADQLTRAIRAKQYEFSDKLFAAIAEKYSKTLPPDLEITFDRYLRACGALHYLDDEFTKFVNPETETVTLTYEQFMGTFMGAP